MKRGRPKNPENIAPDSQPKAVVAQVVPPDYLSDLERGIFTRVANTLQEMNILTIGDADIVATYAQTVALGQLHKRAMDTNGATQKTDKGYTTMSADYLVFRDCSKSAQKILSDLGLTPASRTRVASVVAAVVDDYAEFMSRRLKTDDDAPTPKAKKLKTTKATKAPEA